MLIQPQPRPLCWTCADDQRLLYHFVAHENYVCVCVCMNMKRWAAATFLPPIHFALALTNRWILFSCQFLVLKLAYILYKTHYTYILVRCSSSMLCQSLSSGHTQFMLNKMSWVELCVRVSARCRSNHIVNFWMNRSDLLLFFFSWFCYFHIYCMQLYGYQYICNIWNAVKCRLSCYKSWFEWHILLSTELWSHKNNTMRLNDTKHETL